LNTASGTARIQRGDGIGRPAKAAGHVQADLVVNQARNCRTRETHAQMVSASSSPPSLDTAYGVPTNSWPEASLLSTLQRHETTAVPEVYILDVGQPLPQYQVHRSLHNGQNLITAGVIRRYSNRPDLLEQLRKVSEILSYGGQDDGACAEVTAERVTRSRRLRDRFSSEDLQAMIDLYRVGTTAREVAEKFGISLRSVKRLLHRHGIRREGHSCRL
jgi:hypothetical protein